jgi:hypothetical protein
MKNFSKPIVSLVIACMILLPFSAQAGMVSTDQAIASAQDLTNRVRVQDFFNRAEVTAKLESMGLTAGVAQDRVKAMTQEEINRIANKIDSVPAGGWYITTGALGIIAATIIVLVALTTRN